MIEETLEIPIIILYNSGLSFKSTAKLESAHFSWRQSPSKIGCEISLITKIQIIDEIFSLILDSTIIITFKCVNPQDSESLHLKLTNLINNDITQTTQTESNKGAKNTKLLKNSIQLIADILLRQENAYESLLVMNIKDATKRLTELIQRSQKGQLYDRFIQWCQYIKYQNHKYMLEDRNRWRLHALSNQALDLQAWYVHPFLYTLTYTYISIYIPYIFYIYMNMLDSLLLICRYHSIYYKEVYRPRGRFWYRDAVLPLYRHSYDLIDNVLSPAEEAALDHVLCSPETSYGDVAGQVRTHTYFLLSHM